MFCPPGYANWIETRQDVKNMAQRIYLADALELLGEDPQLALDDGINPARKLLALHDHKLARTKLNLKDTNFEVELISFWIMNRLDEDYSAALCSNAGNLLRANHPIFFHPDQFFYFYLRFPLREMTELTTIFDEYDAKKMSGRDLWDRYTCIDGDTGLIKLKNQTKRQFVQNFGGNPDYNSDGGVFDDFVKPYLGWYVVFNTDLYPESTFGFFESINLLNKSWTDPEFDQGGDTVPKKRGPKPAPAKQEFARLYPNGLPDELSADAVAAELTEAGFPITGRSVQNYNRSRNNSK